MEKKNTDINMNIQTALFERLDRSKNERESPCVNSGNRQAIKEFVKTIHSDKSYFEDVDDLFGGTNDLLIANHDRYGIPINTVFCADTGLIRSTPYYNDKAIKIFYEDYYREIYSNSFGSPFAPKSTLTQKQINQGISILEKTNGKLRKRSRILDYGCGIGATLLPFKEAGHSVLGIDYGREYLDYGRSLGVHVEHGGLEVLDDCEPFDLIILSHVLEHLKQPVQFLKSLVNRLLPDGIIYIDVPGIQWVHRTWNHDLLLYLQNAHVWYFSKNTLQTLISQAGLSVASTYGSVAVLARNSDITPMRPSSDHAARCLKYLKANEWIKTHGLTSNGFTNRITRRMLYAFNDL